MIDLRSDTVTRPSTQMREAMLSASVGDAVWGDDPTVLKLEERLATMAGMEAGLFFPSGTQSNLAALIAHCERGDEYIVGQQAHTYKFEGGGAAVLGSIQPQPIENAPDGSLPLEKIKAAIKPEDIHFARSRLLALENTIGGQPLSLDYMRKATELAHQQGLATHLDGARLFNALIATGVSLPEVCRQFDSVSICFSKGLGAPVGSVLLGTRLLIEKANRWRKVLGGGMRQSGLLAAACLFALDYNVERLAKDHNNAHCLAEGLASLPGVVSVQQATNILFVQLTAELQEGLEDYLHSRGILASIGLHSRFVTHLDVSSQEIEHVIAAVKEYAKYRHTR